MTAFPSPAGEDSLTTDKLTVGAPLTAAQIQALRTLERVYLDGRGLVFNADLAETVLHEFGCHAEGSCCCRTTRALDEHGARYADAIAEAAYRLAGDAMDARAVGDDGDYADLLDDLTREFADQAGVEYGTPEFQEFAVALDARVAALTGLRVE